VIRLHFSRHLVAANNWQGLLRCRFVAGRACTRRPRSADQKANRRNKHDGYLQTTLPADSDLDRPRFRSASPALLDRPGPGAAAAAAAISCDRRAENVTRTFPRAGKTLVFVKFFWHLSAVELAHFILHFFGSNINAGRLYSFL